MNDQDTTEKTCILAACDAAMKAADAVDRAAAAAVRAHKISASLAAIPARSDGKDAAPRTRALGASMVAQQAARDAEAAAEAVTEAAERLAHTLARGAAKKSVEDVVATLLRRADAVTIAAQRAEAAEGEVIVATTEAFQAGTPEG